jgi:hypothetical protein
MGTANGWSFFSQSSGLSGGGPAEGSKAHRISAKMFSCEATVGGPCTQEAVESTFA